MSNHIAAKFFGLMYAPVAKERFIELIPSLIEELRGTFPRFEEEPVNELRIDFGGDAIKHRQELAGKELNMVDAEGLWAVKIGNNGINFSTSSYVTYEDSIAFIENVLSKLDNVIGITHFSKVHLRNINLFDEVDGEPNHFQDIKDKEYWGRQDFNTFATGFVCNGASTRHEYYSGDYLKLIQLSSGIVLNGQSYIPQNEWRLWKLRGGIPVRKQNGASLLIDITGHSFEAPVNVPEKQNNVSPFELERINASFDALHDLVNSVYSDIIKE